MNVRVWPQGELETSYHSRLAKLERVDALPELYPRAVQQLAHLAINQPQPLPRVPKRGAGRGAGVSGSSTPAASGAKSAGGQGSGGVCWGAGGVTPGPGSRLQLGEGRWGQLSREGMLVALSGLLALPVPHAPRRPPSCVIEDLGSVPLRAGQFILCVVVALLSRVAWVF